MRHGYSSLIRRYEKFPRSFLFLPSTRAVRYVMPNVAQRDNIFHDFVDDGILKYLYSLPFKRYIHEPSVPHNFKLIVNQYSQSLTTVVKIVRKRIEHIEDLQLIYKFAQNAGVRLCRF